ncbi:MAG: hypothetical protein R2932_45370 [Caldilineaceae bacterium]
MIVSRPESPAVNTYCSYLVRFWQSNEHGSWRASAQCVQTGDTILFGTVAQLVAFLQAQLGNTAHQDKEQPQ